MLPQREPDESAYDFANRVNEMEMARNEFSRNWDKYERLKKFMPEDQAWESVFGPISENIKKETEALKAMVAESRNAMQKKYEKILETMNGKKDD